MGRLIDADALMEYIGVERLDSRERIAELIQRQPTVEPCEDAINRQAALNELEHLRELSADGEMIEADDVLTTLTFLPSVQPQRKRGKWLSDEEDTALGMEGHCSECCCCTPNTRFKYCPNCGAEMEEHGEQSKD